jgi:hypothetical protein
MKEVVDFGHLVVIGTIKLDELVKTQHQVLLVLQEI